MNKTSKVYTHNRLVTFRRWKRHGYAVFQSLHRAVKIGSLSVPYLLFALPSNAEPQMITLRDTLSTLKELEVEEVVVSAQRAPVAFSQVARIVKVIGKDEIQKAPVQSIQDLLEYVMSVDIRQRGNNGVQADISIRGSSFDQVLVLLNGVNINDPQTGHHNLNLPVSFDAIERIELLEGPASRVYGTNAFSGAINIITNISEQSNLKVRLSGGQYGFWDAAATGTFVTGKISNMLSINHRSSDGYTRNTDFKVSDAFYQGQIESDAGKFQLQGGYSERGFGANSFYTPAYPNQFEQIRTYFASAKMETGKTVRFTPAVYWRRNQDRFELFRGFVNAASWYKTHNYHLTDTYGTNLNAWFASNWGKTAFGADFRSENIWSNVLGKPMDKPIDVPGESGHQFTFSDTRTNFSLFFEQSKNWNKLTLSGGLMANWNSALGRNWNIYPGLDLSWQFTERFRYYASANKSLRLPTFTDLYYKSATNIGNSSLKPEEATAFETGLKYKNSWLEAHATWFRRWGTNMIDWVREPGESVWYAKNITKLNTDGIELAVHTNPSRLFGGHTFIQNFDVSYAWLNQKNDAGLLISKYVLDYLKHKIDIRFGHSVIKNMTINWQFSYQDRNGTFTRWEGSGYGNEVEYKPFWLVDARLNWSRKGTNVYLEASNLLNRTYWDFGNIEQPGTWLKAGIIHRFNF